MIFYINHLFEEILYYPKKKKMPLLSVLHNEVD